MLIKRKLALEHFTKTNILPSKHTTSFIRWYNVVWTSFQRFNNVETTPCAYWVGLSYHRNILFLRQKYYAMILLLETCLLISSKHAASFWRWYNVLWTSTTLKRRRVGLLGRCLDVKKIDRSALLRTSWNNQSNYYNPYTSIYNIKHIRKDDSGPYTREQYISIKN